MGNTICSTSSCENEGYYVNGNFCNECGNKLTVRKIFKSNKYHSKVCSNVSCTFYGVEKRCTSRKKYCKHCGHALKDTSAFKSSLERDTHNITVFR